LTQREARLLLLAGAAGGIGAIFRTPLGAALFIIEVPYRDDTEVDAFMPAVLSSVAGYSTFTLVLGNERIFGVPTVSEFHPVQLPLYVLMALGCALFGFLFVEVFYGSRALLSRQKTIPAPLLPALGGLGVGALALLTPVALGTGYGALQQVFHEDAASSEFGWMAAATLLGLALLKIVTTTLSVSTGGSGGVFGPSVVIGGFVGAAFGQIFNHLVPEIAPAPSSFVVVGMAAFVGGVARAPVSTLVMATEMTGNYELLVPLMLAEAITFVVLQPWTLYEKQVPSRKESGAHWAEHMFDVLHDHHVEETYRPSPHIESVDAATSLGEVLRKMSSSSQTVYPVVGSDGRPHGLVTLDGLRSFMYEEELGTLAVADDCYEPFVTLRPSDTLSTALDRFISTRMGQLPVVDEEHPDRIIGLLSYEDLMATYDEARVDPSTGEHRQRFSLGGSRPPARRGRGA
jgi:CIC family chloride channel protein